MRDLEKDVEQVFVNQKNRIYSIIEVLKKVCKMQEESVDTSSVSIEEHDGHIYVKSITGKFDGAILADNLKDMNLSNEDRILVKLIKDENDKYSAVSFIKKIGTIKEVAAITDSLVQKGIAYEDKKEGYRLFPTDFGYVQGAITINSSFEGFIDAPNGGQYYIHPNDINDALDGDIVVVKPSDKESNGNIIGYVDKIIRRKDGILIAKIVEKNSKKTLKAVSGKLNHPIVLEDVNINSFNNGDTIAIRINELDKDGFYHAEFIKMLKAEVVQDNDIQKDKKNIDFNPVKVLLPNKKQDMENILKILKEIKNKKYTFHELYKKLGVKMSEDTLQTVLNDLIIEGKVYLDNKGLYSSFPYDLGFVQGFISINKFDEGLLTTITGKKFKIETKDLNDALDGDLVVIRPTRKMKQGCRIATVEKIVQRKDGLVVVEVCKNLDDDDDFYLKPFNALLNHPIKINAVSMKPLVEGDRIVVKINELNNNECYYAGFIKNIGHKDDPDADLKVIAIENNIIIDFSDQALAEAENLPTEVTEEEKVGRLDLTDEMIFTIDGAKTKDRDDAISIAINENGNYVVGVHISDVTHYVHPGMKLWTEALSRATSVYMADTVIPMIPHKLSNGICSLNEGVDRLTFSCIMEVTPSGHIISFDFIDSVINSRKAMTYEDVNKYLEDGEIPEGYEDFVDDLDLMNQLSIKLEKLKEKRGYINFGSNDLEIEMDDKGNPLSFKQRDQRTAEKLIENFMLLANECYATYMVIPSPLRVHEGPDTEKVEEAFELLDKSGIRVRASHDLVNGKIIQQILEQIKDMDERSIAANIILRSMKRARYDVEKIGHFGLALENYGHWTSPIRRAADLRGHYNLRLQRDGNFNFKDFEKFYNSMDEFCQHISKQELNAEQAERDANSFEMIKYINEHIGEKFNAKVTYVTNRAVFIKTEDGIDGRISPDDLEGDRFEFNNRTVSFDGHRTNIRIKIGTQLLATALEANREFKTINFGIESEDMPMILTKRRGNK